MFSAVSTGKSRTEMFHLALALSAFSRPTTCQEEMACEWNVGWFPWFLSSHNLECLGFRNPIWQSSKSFRLKPRKNWTNRILLSVVDDFKMLRLTQHDDSQRRASADHSWLLG